MTVLRRLRFGVRQDDTGSATIYVLGLTSVVWLAGLVVLLLAQIAIARARAATAADLAALAGASHVLSRDSCEAAAKVAKAQGAELSSCRVDAWDVGVVVSVRLSGPLAHFPPAEARARAGPAQ